jgi:hypothetical protein
MRIIATKGAGHEAHQRGWSHMRVIVGRLCNGDHSARGQKVECRSTGCVCFKLRIRVLLGEVGIELFNRAMEACVSVRNSNPNGKCQRPQESRQLHRKTGCRQTQNVLQRLRRGCCADSSMTTTLETPGESNKPINARLGITTCTPKWRKPTITMVEAQSLCRQKPHVICVGKTPFRQS